MIYIVLIEPESEGNVGAVARVMHNFGFDKLVLINPRCDYLSEKALVRAMHGKDILRKAIITDFNFINTLDIKVGTTAKVGGKNHIFRTPLKPEEMSKMIVKSHRKSKIGLLFGRESIGLTNDEIRKCDYIVTIPANPKYPTLNLSHAVAILLYELFKNYKQSHIEHFELASSKEKEILFSLFDRLLEFLNFSTEEKKETQKIAFRRIIGKSHITKKEIYVLLGLFRKILYKFEK